VHSKLLPGKGLGADGVHVCRPGPALRDVPPARLPASGHLATGLLRGQCRRL